MHSSDLSCFFQKMRMDLNPNTVMLLLRQENDRIDDQLRKKREEVTKRIETCRIKQQELKKKDCEVNGLFFLSYVTLA